MIKNCLNWRSGVCDVGMDKLYEEVVDPFDYPDRETVFEHWRVRLSSIRIEADMGATGRSISTVYRSKDYRSIYRTSARSTFGNSTTLSTKPSIGKPSSPTAKRYRGNVCRVRCLYRPSQKCDVDGSTACSEAAGRHIEGAFCIVDLKGLCGRFLPTQMAVLMHRAAPFRNSGHSGAHP